MPLEGAHGKVACVTISGILTAMVTPFDADGGLAEEATAALVRHLLANGSDGVVLTGTTGDDGPSTAPPGACGRPVAVG